MAATSPISARSHAFCDRYGIRAPILLAPMAGACPTALSAAVARAGGLGACGALLMSLREIAAWAADFRAAAPAGAFQINLWTPDPPPIRDFTHEAVLRAFLAHWGPAPSETAGDATPPDFDAQCDAVLDAGPSIVSSIMGLFPPAFVERLKRRGIAWWATVTTLAEARLAETAGADVLVAQGMEAGGHRGAFDAGRAEAEMVGLFSLVPAVADAVRLPVVATGGIADERGVAAALALGASAVQIGTGFLRCPEAGLPPAWADALARTPPEGTQVTCAFSGRPGRAIATPYVEAAAAWDAPRPAPYPVQRGLTEAMRQAAAREGDLGRMQAWCGQSAELARAAPAETLVGDLWRGARERLGIVSP